MKWFPKKPKWNLKIPTFTITEVSFFSLNATIALLQTRKTSKNHKFEEFKKKILLPLNEDKVELSSGFFWKGERWKA